MNYKYKINNIIHYLVVSEAFYKNGVILAKNSLVGRFDPDPVQILNLYRAQCKLEAYEEIAHSLEQILFDGYQKGSVENYF